VPRRAEIGQPLASGVVLGDIGTVAPELGRDVFTWTSNGESMAWAGQRWHVLEPVSAAILSAVDGHVTVDELIDDAISLGLGRSAAEAIVVSALVGLRQLGLVVIDLDLPSAASNPPASGEVTEHEATPEEGTWIEIDGPSGEEIEVTVERNAHGHLQRTERWADGRGRVTTWVSLTSSDGSGEPAAEGVSLADVIPADSCLGTKLRLDEAADMISVEAPDGDVVTIRSTDRGVAGRLRATIGRDRLTMQTGPVVAYVVSPFAGVGPSRVFDRFGRRVGRPRRPEDVVTLVESLVQESLRIKSRRDEGDLMLLPMVTAVHPSGRVALLPLRLASDPARLRAAAAAGWAVHMARGRILDEGAIELPHRWTPRAVVPPDRVSLYVLADDGRSPPLIGLLPEGVRGAVEAQRAAERMDALLGCAEHHLERDFGRSSPSRRTSRPPMR